jgi:hypothetical protein
MHGYSMDWPSDMTSIAATAHGRAASWKDYRSSDYIGCHPVGIPQLTETWGLVKAPPKN